jgi:hypothetical protein
MWAGCKGIGSFDRFKWELNLEKLYKFLFLMNAHSHVLFRYGALSTNDLRGTSGFLCSKISSFGKPSTWLADLLALGPVESQSEDTERCQSSFGPIF